VEAFSYRSVSLSVSVTEYTTVDVALEPAPPDIDGGVVDAGTMGFHVVFFWTAR
jgi:hypothetical protein